MSSEGFDLSASTGTYSGTSSSTFLTCESSNSGVQRGRIREIKEALTDEATDIGQWFSIRDLRFDPDDPANRKDTIRNKENKRKA